MTSRTHMSVVAHLVLLLAIVTPALSQQAPSLNRKSSPSSTRATLYIENKGQWDPRVRFLLRTNGLDTWITRHGVVYDLHKLTTSVAAKQSNRILSNRKSERLEPMQRSGHVVSVNFEGSSFAPVVRGVDRQPGCYNYFIGRDKSRWASNVGLYTGVRIENLYSGVDAVYYLDNGMPRYDLVVAPGADPAQVRMRFDGASRVATTSHGALAIVTTQGTIEQRELYAYQEVGGMRKRVNCGFVVDAKGSVGFDVGAYDRTKPLVVDPLVYSSFLGGGEYDAADGLTVIGDNAIVVGATFGGGVDYPTTPGAYDQTVVSVSAFVTRMSGDGSSLVFSTFVGSHDSEASAQATDVVVDANGDVYIAGDLDGDKTGFPTTAGAFDDSENGDADIFVSKLSGDGTSLLRSTLLGGDGEDHLTGIALDGDNDVYLTGWTDEADSVSFPTTSGAFDETYNGGHDVFVTKFSSDLGSLDYSTMIGDGTAQDGNGVAVDAEGNAYVVGYTFNGSFPTTPGAYDETYNGGFSDIFVTKLNGDGSSLVYSTLIGGDGIDDGFGIAVDESNSVYIAGYTGGHSSTSYPTTSGVYDETYNGLSDVLITKLNPDGDALVYSTLVGGSGSEIGLYMDLADGNVHVLGFINEASTGFPTTSGAVQTSHNGGTIDVFMIKMNDDGSELLYSTLLGGDAFDVPEGIAVGADGDVYLAGQTEEFTSIPFPTTSGAFSTTLGGGGRDAWVCRISVGGEIAVTSPNGGESWCAGSTQEISWTSDGVTNAMIEVSADGGTTWSTIESSTPSDGSYNWSIPANQAAGSDYRVRVSNASDASTWDESDANFTIVNDAPVLTVSLSPTTLWPPNNTMRTIAITASVTDACGSAGWTLTSATGDDGTVAADINAAVGGSPSSVSLRAKRTGNGGGRTYTLVFTASDGHNSTVETRYVYVPQNQSKMVTGSDRDLVARGFSSWVAPNPFTSPTTIGFELFESSTVTVRIYDAAGKEVATLLSGERGAGLHRTQWNGLRSDGSRASSGQYYYTIEAGDMVETGSLILVR